MAKREVLTLWLAARDPRVPWHAKLIAGCVAAYALSPIDLIPDFIPILGYADDLVIVPAGIFLAVSLIPKDVLDDLRNTAAARVDAPLPRSIVAAVVILLVWAAGGLLIGWLVWPRAEPALVGT